MHRRWLVNRTNSEYLQFISRSASISPVFAQVLINRGIKTASDISLFLNPGITSLSDPFDLPDMRLAVDRIKTALRNSHRVLIHGDYDADGLTATAILLHALRKTGMDVHYFIPNRIIHGYGFNPPSVEIAKKLGAKLIITVDCGITSFEAVSKANQEGMDVIISDHHEPAKKTEVGSRKPEVKDQGSKDLAPSFELPEAVAIINPKISNLSSQISDLSGAGIAFKIAQAMAMEEDLLFDMDDCMSLCDLAALGTIADVVPLTGENRIIVKEGLKGIQNGYRQGIRSLKEIAGLNDREIKAGLLSYTMVPRINAAGRIADSSEVVRLFLSDSDNETSALSSWLDHMNTERQRIEEEVYQQALEAMRADIQGQAIVLYGEGWHQGVLGIVASRIAEEFYKPTFVFSIEKGIAKGSARSIPSFDLCNGLSQCRHILLSFGGHKQAAGVKMTADSIPAFKEMFDQIIRESLTGDDMVKTVEIDADVFLSDINHSLVKELSLLEPLGHGNPDPLLGSRMLEVISPRIVGNNHLKMKLRHRAYSVDAIGFDMGGLFENLHLSTTIDAAFTPAFNDWNGSRYLQLILRAFRPSP